MLEVMNGEVMNGEVMYVGGNEWRGDVCWR